MRPKRKIKNLHLAKKSKYLGKYKPGNKINNWSVINGLILIGKTKGKNSWKSSGSWLEVMCECGAVEIKRICDIKRYSECFQCSRKKFGLNQRRENNATWNGFEELPGTWYSKYRRGAISRNFEFNVSIEELWKLFLKQNRKCKLSGVQLTFPKTCRGTEGTASLDRIDSSGSYDLQNLQWVHKDLNRLKMDLHDDEFIEWCHKVSKHQKKLNRLDKKP